MAAAQSLSNPSSTTSLISQSRNQSKPTSPPSFLKPHSLQSPWLGFKISFQPSKTTRYLPNHRPITATISLSLPTSKTDRVASAGKVPKWSRRAIKSFAMAELEARKLKYPTTGTESLLMGILIEGTNLAAKFLRANGITLFKVRDETVKLLGKGDMFFFSPEHPPLTEDAQRALDWAVDEKLKSGGDGEITTTHLLLGIWSEVESPGHKILAALGFNDAKSKELTSMSSEPESVDGFPSEASICALSASSCHLILTTIINNNAKHVAIPTKNPSNNPLSPSAALKARTTPNGKAKR